MFGWDKIVAIYCMQYMLGASYERVRFVFMDNKMTYMDGYLFSSH